MKCMDVLTHLCIYVYMFLSICLCVNVSVYLCICVSMEVGCFFERWFFCAWIKIYFFLAKWTRHIPCFMKVGKSHQNLRKPWRHVQRKKNNFLTHCKNSRIYGSVSRGNSDWFLDYWNYQCRYDREEDTTFFSEIFIYWSWYSFLIYWWFPHDLKRKLQTSLSIIYQTVKSLREKKQKGIILDKLFLISNFRNFRKFSNRF